METFSRAAVDYLYKQHYCVVAEIHSSSFFYIYFCAALHTISWQPKAGSLWWSLLRAGSAAQIPEGDKCPFYTAAAVSGRQI